MEKLLRQFINYLKTNHLLDDVQTVVVGLSGGVDSMVLINLLIACKDKFGIEIAAAHVNHQLRGEESDSDEKLVVTFCKQNGIPFYHKKVNVNQYARTHHLSKEMAGRELRYAFFREISGKYEKSVIATGHTADDQTETILLRFLKGASLKGLEGIAPQRENIIHPFLFARKSQLFAYANSHHIAFCEDRTNFEEYCLRNTVRNILIPKIEKSINPSLNESICEISQTIAEINDVLRQQAKQALEESVISRKRQEILLEISRLKKYLIGVEKEIIRQCVYQLKPNCPTPGFKTMNQLISMISTGETGNYLHLTDNIYANIDRGRLLLFRKDTVEWNEIAIQPNSVVNTTTFRFECQIVDSGNFNPLYHHQGTEFIDLDTIHGNLRLRRWINGDKIVPFGSKSSKKLSDIFTNKKIPTIRKHEIPILTDDEKIIWICGMTLSDECKISSKTQHILKLSYKENDCES